MALNAFVEERLELCIDYGAIGGPNFSTSVVTQRNGVDFRNINWPVAKGRWQIGDRVVTKAELENILNFFSRRRGAAVGFRWKDWSDYQMTNQVARAITPVEYQIVKTYGERDEDAYSVDITKPVPDKITVFNNDVELIAGVGVSNTTGLIKLDQPISGDLLVTGEFDKAVRFDVDNFDVEFNAFDEITDEALYSLTAIPVIELR